MVAASEFKCVREFAGKFTDTFLVTKSIELVVQKRKPHQRRLSVIEFRECFYLFVHSRQITSLDELTLIMRSLGFSPTVQELISYLKKYNGKMSFADFLETMHRHSKSENLPDEVIAAFKAMDTENTGTIPTKQLAHLMQCWGEGLSMREIDNIFREANVKNNSLISYSDFVKIASAPVPDYY